MKCTSCGYNLGLEDNWCPHCGTKNMQAAMHNQDMEIFNKEFEETLDEVKNNSRKFNYFTVKITVIAALVALIAITIILIINSSGIVQFRTNRRIKKNLKTYVATIEEYEKNRDPQGFMMYSDANKLIYSNVKEMEKYDTAYQISRYYCLICEDIARLVDERQMTGNYYTMDNCIERIQKNVAYMKSSCERKEYNEKDFEGLEGEYIDYLVKLTEDTVKVHFNLTDEEAEEMWDMGTGKCCLLLEEGLNR